MAKEKQSDSNKKQLYVLTANQHKDSKGRNLQKGDYLELTDDEAKGMVNKIEIAEKGSKPNAKSNKSSEKPTESNTETSDDASDSKESGDSENTNTDTGGSDDDTGANGASDSNEPDENGIIKKGNRFYVNATKFFTKYEKAIEYKEQNKK